MHCGSTAHSLYIEGVNTKDEEEDGVEEGLLRPVDHKGKPVTEEREWA